MSGTDHIFRLQWECRRIVTEAGKILMHYFHRPLKIEFKGQFNMVTEADLASEDFILKELSRLDPGIPVLSEESFESEPGNPINFNEYDWIVDPLDGTTNFAHKLPHFCISLALLHSGNPIMGIVYNPFSNEFFSAVKNHGSYFNGEPTRVSSTTDIEHSLLVTGFPYKIQETKKNNLVEFCVLRLRSQGVRRFGAAALDLAWVASGRFDAYWERWLKPWDTAAGILLITESGGSVSSFSGTDYSIVSSEILVSNGLIHAELCRLLSHSWPELPDLLTDT